MNHPPRGLAPGMAQLGQAYGVMNRTGRPDAAAARAIIVTAAARGVGALYTAPSYGESEALIGAARTPLPVMTKLLRGIDPAVSVAASCTTLGRDHLDVVFLHDPALVTHDPDGVIDRASALVGGPIGALGASVYTPEEFAAACTNPRLGVVQAPINVADQRLVPELLGRAAESGTVVYARSVYLQGLLLGGPADVPDHLALARPLVAALTVLTEPWSAERRALLVGFVRDLGVAGVLVGAETVAHVHEAADAFAGPPLTITDRQALRRLAAAPLDIIDPRRWPSLAAS